MVIQAVWLAYVHLTTGTPREQVFICVQLYVLLPYFTSSWFLLHNADKTTLYLRCVPTQTLLGREEKSVAGFKMNKERITLLLCTNASGRHLVKLFVVDKCKKTGL